MRRIQYISLIGVLIIFLSACSTKKNNAFIRSYHYVTARYNVYFNGNEAFKKGDLAVNKANVDNYNEVLNVFIVSNHDAAGAASGDMDRVIEKCQKTIKLHSIVKKPKKDRKKLKDPKYIAFMAKEEYNPMVQEAWLLIGKAQFYKLDFLAAQASFAYIIRHFDDNVDVATEAKLWSARCFSELGWYYDAEDELMRMDEKTFVQYTSDIYVKVMADLLIKQKKYEQAEPFVETAFKNAKTKDKPRLAYILAQLKERQAKYKDAFNWYTTCLDERPLHEMTFNAILGQARCHQGSDKTEILAKLRKLIKQASNADYLDQVYYTIGSLYQRNKDEQKAIEFYQKAIDVSTRGGIDKAKALLALGKIYFDHEDYLRAQPLYNEALPIVPTDYENYSQLNERTTTLNEIAKNLQTVLLQDSLQALAKLPYDEQVKVIEATIKQRQEQEKLEQEKLEAAARLQDIRDQNAAVAGMSLGQIADRSWYFYNPTLVSRGKVEFKRAWGNRNLEDDWRRESKSLAFSEDSYYDDDMAQLADTAVDAAVDTINNAALANLTVDDVAYHINLLPTTEQEIEVSNTSIRDAMYESIILLIDELKNYKKAEQIFLDLEKRFPDFAELDEANYRLYKMYKNDSDNERAEQIKQKIITKYPDSKYAMILQNKNLQNVDLAAAEEKLYRETYAAFKANKGDMVVANAQMAEKLYPESELLPKFLMLSALSTGYVDGKEKFKENLKALAERFPNSEITPMAKNMVALVDQGKQIQSTSTVSFSNIQQHRKQVVDQQQFEDNIQKAGFQYEPDSPHSCVILVQAKEDIKNKVLFAIANYNFTRFLIKDFDINVRQYNDSLYAVVITGLINLDEAIWYQKSLMSDTAIKLEFKQANAIDFTVSEGNYSLIFDRESALKYLDFYQQNILEIKDQEKLKEIEKNAGFVNTEPNK